MHALVLVNISLHVKFELPSFIHSKDVMGAPKFKKKQSADPNYDYLRAGCHSKAYT